MAEREVWHDEEAEEEWRAEMQEQYDEEWPPLDPPWWEDEMRARDMEEEE